MKIVSVFLISLLSVTESCDVSGIAYKEKYETSLSVWKEMKQAKGKSYVYQSSFSSWVGYRNNTELKVVDDKVVSRKFEELKMEAEESKDITEKMKLVYHEEGQELGKNKRGKAAKTIDELYTECKSKYLSVDEKENHIYFEVDKQGIMSTCGYVPENCADDCFEGIRIDSVAWIQ